jgi:hypothetical protein
MEYLSGQKQHRPWLPCRLSMETFNQDLCDLSDESEVRFTASA